MAYTFAKTINDVHKEGFGADGVGGRALFTELQGPKGASGMIAVSNDVKGSLDAIAAGYSPDAAGDNRVALRIGQLQSEALLPGTVEKMGELPATQTLNESLNSMVDKIATTTAHDDQIFHHQEAVVNQLENYRQGVSGVSLEEEAVNMMQYQTAFQAAAKCMKMGDELFQTVLKIKD